MLREETQAELSNKVLARSFARWFLTAELSNSFERLQALLFANSIAPALNELYKDDPEELSAAYTRHLQFYNSEATFGAMILGITMSMEEERANGAEITDEAITGIKTGLMGPMAGIGDTLIWGTIKPIILGLAVSFALQGNPIAAAIPFLFPLSVVLIGYNNLKLGYRLGRDSVTRLMQDGSMNRIINAASILGLFMMGALSSSYVNVSTPLVFEFSNTDPIVLQDILNNIVPGILPLLTIFGIYYYFKNKETNYTKVLFIILGISFVAAFFGILG